MTTRARTIVAGVSELAAYDLSLRTALELGRRSGATVHLVHAFDLPPLLAGVPGVEVAASAEWARLGPGLRAGLEHVVRALNGHTNVHCHAEPGPPSGVIRDLAEATGADLIVVGAAHAGRMRQAFLGTVAQRVLRAAHVPVLVVRTPVASSSPRVLLSTDLSQHSAVVHERGLDVVEEFFTTDPAAVRALLVAAFGFVSPALAEELLAAAATEALRRYLARRRPRGYTVEAAVRSDSVAAAEIVDEAAEWHADLLVVGTHARHGIDRMLLGSTAEPCLRDASCNVLAVPPLSPSLAPAEHAPAAAAVAPA